MPLKPPKIEHLIDTDLDPKTGRASYHYNYLIYTFDTPAGPVTARSYLDTPKEITLLKAPSGTDISPIIDYLKSRYLKVKRL